MDIADIVSTVDIRKTVEIKLLAARYCLYYHHLSAITMLDEFPLPCLDDTLDLCSCRCEVFHHIRLS